MKRRVLSIATVALPIALCAAACGSDRVSASDEDTTASGDTTVVNPDVPTSADVADTVAPTALPNACDGATPCSNGDPCRSGVCVPDPPEGVSSTITDPGPNIATADAPDLSCLDSPAATPPGPATVTLYGAVARFGSGRPTNNIRVDVLDANGFDPSGCEATDALDARRDCYRSYGTVIGTALSAPPPMSDSLPSTCEGHEDCPLGYQCFDPNDLGGTCEVQFGLFEIADVPTNTELIIRSYATEFESRWHDTYVTNVVLFADQAVDGRIQFDATMVSEGQWLLTTNSVQLSEIPPENGAIGGRIRDCRGADRDSWPISEVSVGLANPAEGIVYFNNLEDDTVPLIDRETTNILGRYAALNIPPGWNTIAGSARIGTEVVSTGSVEVYVFPDSLTIVGFPGKQPFWRQE